MEKRILSILVDNTSGVLSRVAGLFSRRGYNIDSITAGVTADQRYSRMTVVCEGDDQMLQQITKQLAKQEDVRDVKVLEQDDSVARESCCEAGTETGSSFCCRYLPCQGGGCK